MKTMLSRMTAGVIAISTLVSATPAFAMFSMEAEDEMEIHSSEGGKMKVKLMMERHEEEKEDDHRRSGSGDNLMERGHSEMMRLEVTADQQASMLERMEKRTMSVLKRAINLLGKFAKRTCGATEDTDTGVATCVANVKSRLKAQFDIMIDAAFGA